MVIHMKFMKQALGKFYRFSYEKDAEYKIQFKMNL